VSATLVKLVMKLLQSIKKSTILKIGSFLLSFVFIQCCTSGSLKGMELDLYLIELVIFVFVLT
jgi:hypothetical protein